MSDSRTEVAAAGSEKDLSMRAAWEAIRASLRRDCGARTFDGWLRPIEFGGFNPACGSLRLELPSQFMADWVRTHFAERLALAWKAASPDVRQVVIGVGAQAPRTASSIQIPGRATPDPEQAPMEFDRYSVALQPR